MTAEVMNLTSFIFNNKAKDSDYFQKKEGIARSFSYNENPYYFDRLTECVETFGDIQFKDPKQVLLDQNF